METQNQNLPAVISGQQITELTNLPQVYLQNRSLADRAIAKVKEALEQIKAIDLTTASVDVMEAHDATLSDLQVKLRDSYKIMQDRRKPYTQRMDEIKALFTGSEGDVEVIGKEVKGLRDNWQKEKARRARIEEEKRQAELQKKQEEIDMRTYAKNCLFNAYAAALQDVFTRMNNAFNGQHARSLDAYGEKLKAYVPVLDADTYGRMLPKANAKPQFYTMGEAQAIYEQVAREERPALAADYTSRITAERDRLIELIPSRKRELERIAGDATAAAEAEARMKQEAEERQRQLEQEAADRKAAAESAAEVESMNAAFDTASEATPVMQVAKGTVVKKKYEAKTHAAWVAIIQSWVANDMNKMTIEELGKKLSFMKTAAEKRLNEGVELKAAGLEVEEDYSTRATRSKTKEAA